MSDKLLQKILETQQDILAKVEAYQKSTSDQVSKLSKKLRNVQLTTIGLPLKSISPTNLEIESESETDAESIRARTSGAVSPSHSRFSKSYHTDPTSPKSQQASLAAPLYNHRIILTTYPGQHGVSPIPLTWGSSDPKIRGPVVSSRHPSSIKLRNSVGAHGGSYSVYRALAIAMGELQPDHKPDLLNTEPVIQIGPHPSWNEPHTIVSIDPFGADVATCFRKQLQEGIDVRPTIAITKAHMRLAEIEDLVRKGSLKVDGKIVVSSAGELMVTKGAVEPVWWLPGIARRFGVQETTLRRALL